MSNFTNRRPSRQVVENITKRVAAARGVPVMDIYGAMRNRTAVAARVESWRRILACTGCSQSGLATVWGCDRQAIRRAMMRLHAADAKRWAELGREAA